jgi:hypothetical protein
MLFLLFGSSASGKTTVMHDALPLVRNVEGHDFDELEPPPAADLSWRHRANRVRLARALELEQRSTDLLLCGQTPLGELLAMGDATKLEAISACLIDCDDATRAARLDGRGPEWFERTAGDFQKMYSWPEWVSRHLMWADWLRQHAKNPTYMTHAIHSPETEDEMRWERWNTWTADDPRWHVEVLDTTTHTRETAAQALAEWIETERALRDSDKHPLARGRWASLP